MCLAVPLSLRQNFQFQYYLTIMALSFYILNVFAVCFVIKLIEFQLFRFYSRNKYVHPINQVEFYGKVKTKNQLFIQCKNLHCRFCNEPFIVDFGKSNLLKLIQKICTTTTATYKCLNCLGIQCVCLKIQFQ